MQDTPGARHDASVKIASRSRAQSWMHFAIAASTRILGSAGDVNHGEEIRPNVIRD
jgi:hypothetical protein